MPLIVLLASDLHVAVV